MKKKQRRNALWISIAGMLVVGAAVVSFLVLAGSEQTAFTATPYSDVVRFEAEGVATLQVRIFDLSGKEVWDSGVMPGGFADWDRVNEWGERLAYGVHLYSAQGWDWEGGLELNRTGKVVLLPGDQVQLQSAPVTSVLDDSGGFSFTDNEPSFGPMAVDQDHSTESWAFGQVGIGTTNPGVELDVIGRIRSRSALSPGVYVFYEGGGGSGDRDIAWRWDSGNDRANMYASIPGIGYKPIFFEASGFYFDKGNVSIGTTTPTATLEIHGSETNLLALYDSAAPGDAVFRVTKAGEVRADGAFYSGAGDCSTGGFNAGGADVAERINISEWAEPGNVVEIDPDHPGFFRKASSPYSTKVAGIISTSPGVILGNNFDEVADDWEDNRPVLAIAGRVPVKVTTENGSIRIGDLLVSSSIPGVAMRGNSSGSIGAVVGKAMEPLSEGDGTIIAQVMLR